MHIAVIHSTVYRYSNAVYLEPHTIRLRPREHAAQRLLGFSLEIEPAPAGRAEILDQDGNAVTHAWFDGTTSSLTIRTAFELETLRTNPFDFLLTAGDRDIPVQYEEALRTPLVPYLRAGHDPAVRSFAQEIANASAWNTMEFLAALNRRLFETTKHVTRRDGAPHPPGRTLADGEGSCRDTAVLFCAACRSMGIAARFVSGYERDAALQSAGGDLHAWVEVYLQGGGWRGYDPSRGLAAADAHVAVAAASDPLLAAPVAGTFRGDAVSGMTYSIAMQVR